MAGFAAETLRHRELWLRTFARWWFGVHADRCPSSATTAELASFLIAEDHRGVSAATRKAQLATLRRFFAWLVLTGRNDDDPAGRLAAPKVSTSEISVYRADEVRDILGHTAALDDLRGRLRHVIVSTLRYTGMRSGELRSLRLDRLDLDAGRAGVIGKGSRPRVVVLPPPLQQLLRGYLGGLRPELPDSPLLFANPHPAVTTPQAGFSHEAVYREVVLAGEGAGVAGRHFPHRWRHTFATELVRDGVDIHVVQRLLGHRSIASTVGYTHLHLDDLRRVVADRW
ncbi:tyrosine-type recombinase/integrase [Egicoccus sp. AB-alg6-2]|uniref:tyrosine-type recombinase/integrase n=1 Tax=Egicoccus sp. AB-alg6-2 TaxID=3242692 RepID=UPI00359CC94B